MSLSRPELLALARKYQLLSELRRRRDLEPPPELRALAREFPGALRELDALPVAELERRAASVQRALGGDASEAWLEWMSRYHALMRLALDVKRRLARRRRPSAGEASELARSLSIEIGVGCDPAFVLDVADPPRGRINDVVLSRLGATLGVAPENLVAALFREPAAP